MKGQDLIRLIEQDDRLKYGDVTQTIKMLLQKRLINPSTLIDAQVAMLSQENYITRCHFEDSVVSAMQLFNGNFKDGDLDSAKKRFFYNTSFSKQFPNMTASSLTDEDKQYWSRFFENIYGFRPEEMQ